MENSNINSNTGYSPSGNTSSASSSSSSKQEPSKNYQTLFWVPLLFQTATNVENLIGEMLDLIQDFEYKEQYKIPEQRRSILDKKGSAPRRRDQILGENSHELSTTAVKSVNVVSARPCRVFFIVLSLYRFLPPFFFDSYCL
jgi:hypothetical protein